MFFLLWMLVVLQVLWFMSELSDRLDPQPWGRAFAATLAFVVLSAVFVACHHPVDAPEAPAT